MARGSGRPEALEVRQRPILSEAPDPLERRVGVDRRGAILLFVTRRMGRRTGNLTAAGEPPRLEVVVGWLPGDPERSLSAGSRSLAPAVLYADRVQVICPQSDDALEMQDYRDLREAVPGAVEFMALDTMYPRLDASGKPVKIRDGGRQEPLAPEVWSELVHTYVRRAREAGSADDRIASIARAAVLLEWGGPGEDAIFDWLVDRLPSADVTEVRQGIRGSRVVRPK